MHIAIDDTYGSVGSKSRHVTENRRTHVAIIFPDEEADYIREQITNCLSLIKKDTGVNAKEFHFVDIYNCNAPWDKLPKKMNLMIFNFFAEIYSKYKWPVFIQTIDDRTLSDHDFSKLTGNIDRLKFSKREDLSLLLLLFKIKKAYKNRSEPICIFLDEGRYKPGNTIGNELFHDWKDTFKGTYCSSSDEPLIQIADFLAYSINKSTYLSTKKQRTQTDNWFINLVSSMDINSSDIINTTLPIDFIVEDFDALHDVYRKNKGLDGN